MAALEEKLAEAVRQFPVLYGDFKDNSKKRLAWDDVAKQVVLQTGMYSSSEYSFICLMFSLVRIMLLYGCSFLEFFRLLRVMRIILLSNATPISVYKMQSADCTQLVLDCRSSTD